VDALWVVIDIVALVALCVFIRWEASKAWTVTFSVMAGVQTYGLILDLAKVVKSL
jgi:uncharacterized membrane protein